MVVRRVRGTVNEHPAGSGRWRARYYDGAAKRQVSIGVYDSRDEAIAALESIRWVTPAELARTTAWAEWIEQWMTDHGPRLKPRTQALYRQLQRSHIVPLWGTQQVSAVTQRSVDAWWHSLGTGPTAKAKVWRHFHQLLTAARESGLHDVAIRPPVRQAGVERAPERRLLRDDEVVAIIQACPERWRLVPLLAAGAGLRQGEIFGLRRGCVDAANRIIDVREVIIEVDGKRLLTTPKSDAGIRSVTVDQSIIDAILAPPTLPVSPSSDGLLRPA